MSGTTKRSKKSAQGLKPEFERIATTVMLKAGRLEDAQQFADVSSDAEVHSLVAAALQAQKDYEHAKEEYLKAIKLEHYAPARHSVTNLLIYQAARHVAQEEWPQATTYLDQAISAYPDNPDLRRYNGAIQTTALMRGISTVEMKEAIAHLETLQAEDPSRADVAHQLAMFYHRQAIEAEETSKPGDRNQSWEKAFGNWALVVESYEYWRRWDESREFVYEKPIDDDEIERLRHETISKIIKDIHDQYIKVYSDSDKKSEADRHKDLRAQVALELDIAKALHETVTMLQEKGKISNPVIPCGPLMWKHLGIVDKVEEIARVASENFSSFSPAQDILNALTPVGLAKVMIREGQLREAIPLLEEYLDQFPEDVAAQSVLAEAYMRLAQATSVGNLDEAFKYWEKAISLGAQSEQVENEISDAVFREAKKYEKNKAFEEADRVLRLGLSHVPKSKLLRDKLASTANQRAEVLVSSLQDSTPPSEVLTTVEKAENILREADDLAGPQHPAIRKKLKQLARYLNNPAVSIVDSLDDVLSRVQSMTNSEKQDLIKKLKVAQNMLERAHHLNSQDSSIRRNLEQIRMMVMVLSK